MAAASNIKWEYLGGGEYKIRNQWRRTNQNMTPRTAMKYNMKLGMFPAPNRLLLVILEGGKYKIQA